MRNRLMNLYATNKGRGTFRAEGNTIFIYDVIVGSDAEAEFWGGVSPEAFAKALAGISGEAVLRINSPGGDVFGARAMVQAMREHAAPVRVQVDGWAVSAASVIAAAGDHVVMAEGAFIMIHNAWTITLGNAEDHTRALGLLGQIDASLAESYAARGKLSAEEFAAAMAAETWYGPVAAMEAGLADEIVTAEATKTARAQWNLSAYRAAPQPPREEALAPAPQAPVANEEAARRIRVMRARLATASA